MTEGELRLFTGYEFHLIFSPVSSAFPSIFKPTPFIDTSNNQQEVKFKDVSKDGWDHSPYCVKGDTYRCSSCGITAIKK